MGNTASHLYWPGGTVYEALSEVATAWHFRLSADESAMADILQTPCRLAPGMVTPMDLARAAGDSLPNLLVSVHVGDRRIDVGPYTDPAAPHPAVDQNASAALPALDAPQSAPSASPTVSPAAHADGVQVARRPVESDASVNASAAQPTSVREALRPLLVPVTLERGDLQSVLRQVAQATGWTLRATPGIPMGTIGDGLPWGRPSPALGILRILGRQSYLDVQVFPASRLVIVRIQGV
jgi:hypothetical protein